jgi:diacylglycerol kinase
MKAFLNRLKYALHGWGYFFRKEANGQIQVVIAIMVIIAGFVFGISFIEWLVVLLCIGWVLGLEMVNTAIETLANRLHPESHPEIKVVKDVAAGAVLWAVAMSVIVGGVIFIPRIWAILL